VSRDLSLRTTVPINLVLETKRRLKIFRQNLNRIEELNEKEEGTAVYGISHLTDLSGASLLLLLLLR
jgi:hypothetical protein